MAGGLLAGHWNDDPKPLIWYKTAEEIIENVRGGRSTLARVKSADGTTSSSTWVISLTCRTGLEVADLDTKVLSERRHMPMELGDLLGVGACRGCDRGVLLDELSLSVGNVLAVMSVGLAACLLAIGAARLGKQNERRGVCSLGREQQVEQDEGVRVECLGVQLMNDDEPVGGDPQRHQDGLADDELRRPEESGEALSPLTEAVLAEGVSSLTYC